MMSLYDICHSFPRVSYGNVTVQERNLVHAEMEDGSGYSWNLKAIVDEVELKIYVKFDRVTRQPSSIVIDGKQAVKDGYACWVTRM